MHLIQTSTLCIEWDFFFPRPLNLSNKSPFVEECRCPSLWHLPLLRSCQKWDLNHITVYFHSFFFLYSRPSAWQFSGVTKTTSVDRHQCEHGTKWLGCPMIGIFETKPAYNFRRNWPELSESGAVPSRDVQPDGNTDHTAPVKPFSWLSQVSFIHCITVCYGYKRL